MMARRPDIRDLINPHPACSKSLQQESLDADSAKLGIRAAETYTNDKTDGPRQAAIKSGRRDRRSIIRAMWAFNLAPIKATAPAKRKAITAALKQIIDAGCIFREAATGRQSNRGAELAAMAAQASEMVGNHARGAAGRKKPGRPKKAVDDKKRDAMEKAWFDRRNKTVDAVIDRLRLAGIRTNKNELYRLFGPRNPEKA